MSDEICPLCETLNERLHLTETGGCYICGHCGAKIDARRGMAYTDNIECLPPGLKARVLAKREAEKKPAGLVKQEK